MSLAPDDPRIGTILQGRYEILERLSSGGMGVVYRAQRVQLGRIVAIKFLHAMFSQNAESIRRFELEARAMSRLEHPHCVPVIDFGVADSPFIVMEFVTGNTLRALIDEGPVPPARALPIARQMLAGLAHAHEKGIIHRDVKPANVMLAQVTGAGDHVRILDFGLAKLRDGDASHSSLVVGTPSYMSPEQASGGAVDARCDLYATGVVLFELLTGEKPFFSDQAFETIRMHRETPPPRLVDKLPGAGFSPELEAAVARALAKRPDERFPTPAAFIDALEAAPEWPAGSARPRPAPEASAPAVADPTPSRPARRGGSGAWPFVVLLGGAAGAWWALGRPGWSVVERALSPASAERRGGEEADAARARDAAIRALHERRSREPENAAISFELANLYYEKDRSWHAEALAAYREAVKKDPSYRTHPVLLRNAVSMLDHDEATREKVRAFVLTQLGAAAAGELRRAATSGATPALREHAARLLDEVSRLR